MIERAANRMLGFVERRERLVGRGRDEIARELEEHRDADQVLLNSVMKRPLEPTPLLDGRCHEARAKHLQLGDVLHSSY